MCEEPQDVVERHLGRVEIGRIEERSERRSVDRLSSHVRCFFCPVSPLNLSASISASDGAHTATVAFQIASVDTLPNTVTAASGVGGPTGTQLSQAFDWGAPFFFGRNVYIGFEGTTINSVVAPLAAF